eukprot:EG_transcript_1339
MRLDRMGLVWLLLLALVRNTPACLDSTYVTWNASGWTLPAALPQLCDGGRVLLVGSAWGSNTSHCNISVTKSVTFASSDGNPVVFSCGALPVFWVQGGGNLTLQGLTFANGTASAVQAGGGGLGRLALQGCSVARYAGQCAVQVAAAVSVRDSTFDSNANGALCVTGALDATNTLFINNVAADGAAVSLVGPGSFQRCDFLGNQATAGSGGAISHRPPATSTPLNLTTCLFQANNASASGGAVLSATTLNAAGVQFDRNAAPAGGAVFATSAAVSGSTFTNNRAQTQGGALYASGPVTVSTSQFSNNAATTAPGDGGAVWAGDSFVLSSTGFVGNAASGVGAGGAVYTQSGGTANAVVGCRFVQNSAASGGALRLNVGCLLQDTAFANNTAALYGGAVFVAGAGALPLSGVQASGNAAALGGAVYAPQATASVAASVFAANSATTATAQLATVLSGLNTVPRPSSYNASLLFAGGFGGAAYVAGADVTGSQFLSNVATVAGGALFGGTVSVHDSTLAQNSASVGGAVYAGTAFTGSGSTFAGNTAVLLGGGAVAGLNTAVSLYRCDFQANGAREWGGAVFTAGSVDVHYGNFIGNSGSTGGGLYTAGACAFAGTVFQGNRAAGAVATDGAGGAISCATATTQSCTFTANMANKDGGAVVSPRLTSNSDAFANNTAKGHGGACKAGNASAYLSTFTANSAGGDGGAVAATGNLTAAGNAFQGNSCGQRGGAVAVWAAPAFISAQFVSNSAVKGGALYAGGANYALTLQGLQFTANAAVAGNYSATPKGGAVLADVPVVIGRSSFQQNWAAQAGGAVYGLADVNASDALFSGNWAGASGGAIAGEYPGNTAINLASSLFLTNQANSSDGGAVQAGGAVRATATTFQGNAAGSRGGAVQAPYGPVWATGCAFANNAARNGGAVAANADVQTWQTNFTSNVASANGGAIWAGLSLWAHPGTVFTAGQAGQYGGALYAHTQTVALVDGAALSGNVAQFGGALFAGAASNLTVQGSAFTDNQALQRGPAMYSLGWLSTGNSSFSANTCPLDAYGYLNAWYSPATRRSLTTLTLHWLVFPAQAVGNQLVVQLPKEVQLNRCTTGLPSGSCVTGVTLAGAL